jgi:translation initiation factor 2B subunit (eIF-2B alpha/beta/delta family)
MDHAWASIERAAADRESGASQIARRAATALQALPADKAGPAVELLVRGHPSMAPLWRLAGDVLGARDHVGAAQVFLKLLEGDSEAASALASTMPDRIVTISYSSTVVQAIRIRAPHQTVCMRSDPGGEGWRIAEETRDRTGSVIIDDDQALATVPGDAVLSGADAVTPGGVVNKVKTRALAEAARAKGIPRYAVAGDTKFVGASLPVSAPFEMIPFELFTAIVVPGGLIRPDEARARAEAIPMGPKALSLLAEVSKLPG